MLDCSNNSLTQIPNIPSSLTYVVCAQNRITASLRPLLASDVVLDESENTFNTLSAWTKTLIDQIRKYHTGHAKALEVSIDPVPFKIWCEEGWGNSTIYVKPQEGEGGVIFVMGGDNKFLYSEGDILNLQELNEETNQIGKVLKRAEEEIFKKNGIDVRGNTLYLHRDYLERYPLEVLDTIAKMVRDGYEAFFSTRELNDLFNLSETGIDAGGPSRQLATNLAKALFTSIGDNLPIIKLDDYDLPVCDVEADEIIFQNFGSFLSLVLLSTKYLSTGLVVNPQFYDLLKKCQDCMPISLNQAAYLVARMRPPVQFIRKTAT
jgi:hypothetical protein